MALSRAILTCTVLTASTLIVSGLPAAASPSTVLLTRTSWGYIDSHTPGTNHLNPAGDAPVGKLRDANGEDHRYRSFFTFDLSGLLGARINSVSLSTAETEAGDCVHRRVELWTSGPFGATSTWRNPPAQLRKIDTVGYVANSGCPSPFVEWDATSAVQHAVAAGRSTLTLELRAPQADEDDTRLGRRFANNVAMSVTYNKPPHVPTELKLDQLSCTSRKPYPWLGNGTPTLFARVSDPDQSDSVGAQFALWPTNHPDQRTVLEVSGYANGTVVQVGVPQGLLADATTYAFQARGEDSNNATSAWSRTCYFQTASTRPANP